MKLILLDVSGKNEVGYRDLHSMFHKDVDIYWCYFNVLLHGQDWLTAKHPSFLGSRNQSVLPHSTYYSSGCQDRTKIKKKLLQAMRQLTLQKEKLGLPALGHMLTWAVLPRQKKVMIEAWRSLTNVHYMRKGGERNTTGTAKFCEK